MQEDISLQITIDLEDIFKENRNCHFSESIDFINIKAEISNQDNENLTNEVTDNEILSTVKEMALNKSSGSDGFTIEFFEKILAHCRERNL